MLANKIQINKAAQEVWWCCIKRHSYYMRYTNFSTLSNSPRICQTYGATDELKEMKKNGRKRKIHIWQITRKQVNRRCILTGRRNRRFWRRKILILGRQMYVYYYNAFLWLWPCEAINKIWMPHLTPACPKHNQELRLRVRVHMAFDFSGLAILR